MRNLTVPPILLNEYGMAVWRHKYSRSLFVQRDYEWCDRVVVIDETEGRRIVDDMKFSEFDFADWVPMTVEEYSRVKSCFKEAYLD